MLDYKTETFLTLCDLMNYRRTAEALNMTQPAVTQHIHALEQAYGCTLFSYKGRTLRMTEQAQLLRQHLQKVRYDEARLRDQMHQPSRLILRLGATKSIGDYMVRDSIVSLIASGQYDVHLTVENTGSLLNRIENGQLDVALIEGEFDKSRFGYQTLRAEPFVGICAAKSPLANRVVSFDALRSYRLLLREEGSGTRTIFENQLRLHGESLSSFPDTACISSIPVLKDVIAQGLGITFAYRSIIRDDPRLSAFYLLGYPAQHDLYAVYMKDSKAEEFLSLLNL